MKEAVEANSHLTLLTPSVSERDHAQGPATAAFTLVEYGDYHCPQCAQAQSWVKDLQARLGDRLRFVFRHFPSHGLPPHAAEAAEAAGLQGRFWEMHDVLFKHHTALGNGHLVEYADGLGLDTGRFLRDMAAHTPAERVRLDAASGARSGVRDTPAFFVNGVRRFGTCKGSLLDDDRFFPAPQGIGEGKRERWTS